MSIQTNTPGDRAILLVLAAMAAYPGLWALLAPESFHADFPGGGRRWVGVDGPYNEHLVRDVGAFYVGLMVASLVAAWLASRSASVVVAVGWVVFSLPHLGYHLFHLELFDRTDQVLNVVGLTAPLVLAGLLLRPRATGETR